VLAQVLAGAQLLHQAFVEPSPMTVIDILHTGGLFQAGFSKPIEQLLVGTFRGFTIDQQAEPFLKAQTVEIVPSVVFSKWLYTV
jgi:hypothetical protein